MAPATGRDYNAPAKMAPDSSPSRDRPGVAPLDTELLRSGSILIYCRSSLTLSLFVYASIAAMLYSDLYVHLIRQTADTFVRSRVLPGALFFGLVAGCGYLAHRARPRLEKGALLILALNFSVLSLRGGLAANSDAYLFLCLFSLLLDLGLLAAVIAFYRRYPNYLKLLRCGMGPC